ncbi:MAG: cytochrome c [Gemmatimonadales bacterium]|nr:MAG: cytochrome c [Gemmatimonadales bacterium]
MKRSSGPMMGIVLLLIAAGCGDTADRTSEPADEPENGLTAFEEEHGIGPFTEEVALGPEIDEEMARMGQEVFEFNCEACHALDERFVGPPLGNILDIRSPTFVMNMIMNPSEMAQRHPVVQELLREYPVVMPYQNISEEQARAIVEYLRDANP